MQHQEFVCYKKNDKVMSLGMNLNNIIAKHYYSDKAIKGGGLKKFKYSTTTYAIKP